MCLNTLIETVFVILFLEVLFIHLCSVSNKNLLEQAQSIFTQEFLMLDRIPDGWQESSLLGIADYLNGLAMQKYRPKDDEQGLPVLKIKELRQGSCDFNSELCSPSIKPEYIVHDGDVIFPGFLGIAADADTENTFGRAVHQGTEFFHCTVGFGLLPFPGYVLKILFHLFFQGTGNTDNTKGFFCFDTIIHFFHSCN